VGISPDLSYPQGKVFLGEKAAPGSMGLTCFLNRGRGIFEAQQEERPETFTAKYHS
jgi:hypothetical protein